jgi:hypothetical protein
MKCIPIAFCLPLIVSLAAAQPQYTGAYGANPRCEACHNSGSPPTNQFPYWNSAAHAQAYDGHREVQWNPNCLPCHVTGWDITQNNGGFDDFFYAGDTLGMLQMRNVQCEVCHGPTDQYPHPLTTSVDYHAEICGDCHTGLGRPTFDQWSVSGHAQTAGAAAQNLECAKCHEAKSAANYLSANILPTILPDEPLWEITCAVCHATHYPFTFEPQLYLAPDSTCRACHNMDGAVVGEVPHATQQNMIRGVGYGAYEWPGYPYTNSCHQCVVPGTCAFCHMDQTNYSGGDSLVTGHEFTVRIETCIVCHPAWVPPDSSFDFLGVQSEIDSLLSVLAAALAQADSTTIEYAQAKFDYDFVVADGSRGIHNSFYASQLLISSIENLPPVGIQPGRPEAIEKFNLLHPFPNPLNPTTAITYQLRAVSLVSLEVYDTAGRLVSTLFNGRQEAGPHQVIFDGSNLAAGIYFAKLRAKLSLTGGEGDYMEVEKIVLLK